MDRGPVCRIPLTFSLRKPQKTAEGLAEVCLSALAGFVRVRLKADTWEEALSGPAESIHITGSVTVKEQ